MPDAGAAGWRRLLLLDVAVVMAALCVRNGPERGETVWTTIVATGLGWLVLTWPSGPPGRAVDAARVAGAWAGPLLLLHAATWLRLAWPSVPLVWWGGGCAAVVGGAALASVDGRRRWAWLPSALLVPLVLREDPAFEHLGLTLLGVLLGSVLLWGVALLLSPDLRGRPAPPPELRPSLPPVWVRCLVRALLGFAIARVPGAGGGVLALLVAAPLEARGVRARWIAPALVLGAYVWGVVSLVQGVYLDAITSTRSLHAAFQAASDAVAYPAGGQYWVGRALRNATLVAAVVAPTGALTLASRLGAAALGTVALGALLTLFLFDDRIPLSLDSIPRPTLGLGLWALVGVAVGNLSDRILAPLLAPLAPGSERGRAEPEPNPGPGGPDVAPTR